MRHPIFRSFLFASLLALTAAQALPCSSASTDDLQLTCHVSYAGTTQKISICPTPEPYGHESVSIGNRFRFKAIHVKDENLSARVGIYVYVEDKQQPRLIQHVQIRPPIPKPQAGPAVDLIGEQRLYAGPLERELIYRCVAGKDVP